MPHKEKFEKDPLITLAQKCLKKHKDRESDNITRAKEAIEFRAGQQWPDPVKRDRENQSQDGGPRPCPVLDKTNQYVRQIINEERQNRAAIRVRPVDDDADPKVAEVFTGIIRHIEDASQALEAYTTGGEHAIDGGFGYWRVLTEYTDEMSFDQDIRIKRIPNRFSVALGPHQEPDGADLKEALIWEDMEEDDFKNKYPKAKVTGFDNSEDWKSQETIRVAEYMYIEETETSIHMMPNGEIWTDEQLKAVLDTLEEDADEVQIAPIESRTTTLNSVKWCKLTSEEILEQEDMIGSYIPIIKVVGNELVMPDGKTRLSGAIEAAMDPQRLHNYSVAGFIESVALAPRAPWIAEEGQTEGYENDFAMANRQNISLLKYKGRTEEGHLLPAPARVAPPGVAPGWQQMLQNTEHGVESAFGMYGPSVGAKSQEKSGIALQEQKIQGMVGNYHFPDNLARSIQHTGRILIEWIPKIYDTVRTARILGEDGTADMASLDPAQEMAVAPKMDNMGQEIGSIYNLNVGKYDVTVSTGPSYTAKRQEAAESQIQLLTAKPELMPILGDILLGNMDWPGADKIAERLKTMLPPQIQELEESKDKKPIDPRMKALMGQVEQASQQLEERAQMLAQAEQELQEKSQETEADRVAVESMRKELEAEKKVFMADVKTARADIRADKASLQLEAEKLSKEEPEEHF